MFKKFLAKRKEKQCYRGFSWAATKLLLGEDPNELRQFIYSAKDFGEFNDFDKGAVDALITWEELMDRSSLLSK